MEVEKKAARSGGNSKHTHTHSKPMKSQALSTLQHPPEIANRASQKFLAQRSLSCGLGAPHLVPQPPRHPGPAWGRSPANSWVLRAPARARRLQSFTGRRAPIRHPLLGQSVLPSPASLASLSFPGTRQGATGGGRGWEGGSEEKGPVGGFSARGNKDAVKATLLVQPHSPASPGPQSAPQRPTLHFGLAVWWSKGRGKINLQPPGQPYLKLPSRKPPSCRPRRRWCTAAAPPRAARRPYAREPAPLPRARAPAGGTLARRSPASRPETTNPQPPRRGREPGRRAHEPGAPAERARGPAGRRGDPCRGGTGGSLLRWLPSPPSAPPLSHPGETAHGGTWSAALRSSAGAGNNNVIVLHGLDAWSRL